MKQDDGNHAATPARENISWLRKLEAATDKHDRLKAINAELVEALEFLLETEPGPEYRKYHPPSEISAKARAALAKART